MEGKDKKITLGLRENWRQFTLLVIINAFVGGMIGIERTILPKLATDVFLISASSSILSFIVVFGIVKAITNYFTGSLANIFGRRKLLIAGWIIALPIPFIFMFASSWNWILLANILLGINQGLAWSSTVVMKIDLVGDKNRGLAMGINEFAGYLSIALVGLATGYIASTYGLRPYPFYIGVGLVFLGTITSWLFVQDTTRHATVEGDGRNITRLHNIFWDTTWNNRNLSAVTQAGLVNNLNDGMVWGLFPILLSSRNFNLHELSIITATYPAVWGIGQLFTGKLSDILPKKKLLYTGMFIQGISLLLLIYSSSFMIYLILSSLLGLGTALVYPTFLASISENTHPRDRAKSLGTFRFWRDMGYAIGAFISGIIADSLGINAPLIFIGLLTILSSVIIFIKMK